MADAGTCCIRSGWDLSFIDTDSVRLGRYESQGADCSQSAIWRRSGQDARKNSLGLIVRRRPSHTYSDISPSLCHTDSPLHPHGNMESTTACRIHDNSHLCAAVDFNVTPPDRRESSSEDIFTERPIYQNQTLESSFVQSQKVISPQAAGVNPVEASLCPSSSSISSQLFQKMREFGANTSSPQGRSRSGRINGDQSPEAMAPKRQIIPSSSDASGLSCLHDLSSLATACGCQRPTVLCRTSLSPAADNSMEFLYKDTEDGCWRTEVPWLKPLNNGVCHWRGTNCFASWDLEQLAKTFHRLMLCRFYLGKLSSSEANILLHRFPVGTFLLRDSSDARFPFSLSIQTSRGTTSIRIIYESGLFRLDSEPEQVSLMPTFDCVLRLIQFYVHQSIGDQQQRSRTLNTFVLLEINGQRDIPVLLRRPYESTTPSLTHICRKKINAILSGKSVHRLQLIPSLKTFLSDYPYDI